MNIEHRKPRAQNKIKKRDTALKDTEDRYSIASLLQKKQASQTKEDDKLWDDEDLHAVDEAIAQSEMMRKDTIATTSFSPVKTPTKKSKELVPGVDESFLFVPPSPEEEDENDDDESHCSEENPIEQKEEESVPVQKDDGNAAKSNDITFVPPVNDKDTKSPGRIRGQSVRRKFRTTQKPPEKEHLIPLSPQNQDVYFDHTALSPKKASSPVVVALSKDTDETNVAAPETYVGDSKETPLLASEYLSIHEPNSSAEPLPADFDTSQKMERTEAIDETKDALASAQERLAIQAQRISKFKNSIWSVVGGMVSPRRNTEYQQSLDAPEQIEQRDGIGELDRTVSYNHFSVTDEVGTNEENSDNDEYDYSNNIESSQHSENDQVSPEEAQEKDASDSDGDTFGPDENMENVSEGAVDKDDTVSSGTGSYNELWETNKEVLSSSDDDDSQDDEEDSNDNSADGQANEMGTLKKQDHDMSFGSKNDATDRDHSDSNQSYSSNNDELKGTPSWITNENILEYEDNDVEIGDAPGRKPDGHDEHDLTSQMGASLDRRQRRKRQKRFVAIGLMLCCVIVTVVMIVLLVVLLPKSSSSSDAVEYNDACDAYPTKPETCATIVSAIETNHPNSTWDYLIHPERCQFKALEWLVGSTSDDNLDLLESPTRIRQRYALSVFHCELQGDAWFKQDFHLVGDDNECSWSTDDLGVEADGTKKPTCNSVGEIVIVRIKEEELTGILAPELSMITTLQELSLPNNGIVGSIPSEYSLLVPKLETIVLSSNRITGTLPTFMYDVAFLDLSNNLINGTIPNPPEYTLTGNSSRTRYLDTKPHLLSLILNTNELSGVIPKGLVHPWMKELVLHNNSFSGEFIPPSIDEASSLERLTLYNNNLTGNLNSLCSISSSNGGSIRTLAADVNEIICSCCTPTESNNIFQNPSLPVPEIPPPSLAPTRVASTPPSSVPVQVPTYQPRLSIQPSYVPSTVKLPTISPTQGAISSAPTAIPTATPTAAPRPPTISPALVFPFTNVTTTPLDPFVSGDCYFGDNKQPHVINQCNCYNSISTLYNDTMSLYTQVRNSINQEFYEGLYNTTVDSCQAQNQAMVWLSSGNTRDNGDFYQRYVLAVLYIQMSGSKWENKTRWLSNWNECTWFGVECDATSKVLGINLKSNNVQGSLPSEIKHLQSLETISFPRNQVKGTIPSEIVLLPKVKHLILSSNNISGTIPSFLVSSTSLQSIKFDMNNLIGTIPPWIKSNSNLSIISLNNNGLDGSIPEELSSIQNLTALHLHDNRLSGTLPSALSALTKLQDFSVYGNVLTGVVPSEICQLRTTGKLTILTVESCSQTGATTTGGGITCPTQIQCCTSCG